MFKRFLAICLCVVAFIFSIIPASASSFRSLNLLAYGGGNGVGQTVFLVNPGVNDITFPVPVNSSGYTFDMLFTRGHLSFSIQLIINGSVFNCQLSHGPNYSSAFCNFSVGGFNSVTVRINNSGSAFLLTVLSADINQFSTSGSTVSCSLSGRVSDGTTNIFAYTGSPVTSNFGNLSSHLTDSVEWNVLIPFYSWSTGDFLKLNFYLTVSSITTVNAFLGTSYTPAKFEVSPWNNSTSDVGWSMYHLTVSVDLTQFRKSESSNSNLIIIVSCSPARNASTSFTLTNASIFYSSGESDNTNFFAYWFGVFRDGIGGIFSGLGNWFSQLFGKLSDGFQSVVDAIVGDSQENEEMENEAADQEQALGDLNSSLNDYEKPDPGSMNIDIQVDPVGLGFISGGLGGIYQSSIFGQILTMIGILGLAGYVFFGKR